MNSIQRGLALYLLLKVARYFLVHRVERGDNVGLKLIGDIQRLIDQVDHQRGVTRESDDFLGRS